MGRTSRRSPSRLDATRLVLILLGLLARQATAGDPPTRPDAALRAELLARVGRDQAARKAILATAPSPDAIRAIEAIDRENTAWLIGVMDSRGWLGKSLVGEDGAHAAWLLVQHADRDREFQRRCLGLLRDAQRRGEASGQDLAYLTDRLLVADGKKQLYGTQFRRAAGGTLEPDPIEDEADVDRRRRDVGLGTMAEYREMVRAMYQSQGQPKPAR